MSAGHLNSVTARCPAPSPGCPPSQARECKHCANKSLALLTLTMQPGVGGGRRPTAGATGQAHSIDLWSNLNIIKMGYIFPLWVSPWYGVDKIEMKKSRDDSVELYQARWESAAKYCMVYFYRHSGILLQTQWYNSTIQWYIVLQNPLL